MQTADRRAYDEAIMNKEWARADAIMAREQARQDALIKDQRAYDLTRELDRRAYEEAVRNKEWERADAIQAKMHAREDALTQDQRNYQQSQQQTEFQRAEALRQQQIADLERERQRETELSDRDQRRQTELDTISQYSRDYQAEINRRQSTSDTEDDWLIPYLQAARQKKIKDQNLDQSGRPLPVITPAPEPVTVSSSVAMDLWKTLGTANDVVARALGVPVGTKYKAPSSGSSSGGSSGGGTVKQPLW
jgi:hypothetical protein